MLLLVTSRYIRKVCIEVTGHQLVILLQLLLEHSEVDGVLYREPHSHSSKYLIVFSTLYIIWTILIIHSLMELIHAIVQFTNKQI